jgi:trehalose synthase-fused probable maltokinase
MLDDDSCGSLLRLIASSAELATARGSVKGTAAHWDTQWSEPAAWPTLGPDLAWTRANFDQSNSLAFVTSRPESQREASSSGATPADRPGRMEREASPSAKPAGDRSAERLDLALKVFRRIEPAINPEYEVSRYLSERGFPRTPRLAGALEYLRPSLSPGTLAVAQHAIGHQGSAWDFTIDELRRFYERVAARPAVPQDDPSTGSPANGAFFHALAAYYLQNAELLGRRTAELHNMLAQGRDDAFAPVRMDSGRLAATAQAMLDHAKETLEALDRRLQQVPEPSRSHAEAVVARRDALLSRLDAVRNTDRAGFAIRIHGDYHLGQILHVEEDFVILDFEGEPARPIAERRTKHSPIKDVAGMVRSFGYAAYAALFAFTTHAPDEYAALEFWADTWQEAAARSFTNGYLATLAADHTARFAPEGEAWARLLDAFLLDKALYEVGYELNHRPDWVRIPLLGIRKLIG